MKRINLIKIPHVDVASEFNWNGHLTSYLINDGRVYKQSQSFHWEDSQLGRIANLLAMLFPYGQMISVRYR
jgi:hypothetical protein